MAEDDLKSRIFGSNMGATIIKLLIASIIVGAVFSFLGVGAIDFWRGIFESVKGLISTLGESVGEIALNLATYLVIGAAIVIPIWLIARLLSSRR